MKIGKNMSTPEARSFWKSCAEASKRVARWPKWKRGEKEQPVSEKLYRVGKLKWEHKARGTYYAETPVGRYEHMVSKGDNHVIMTPHKAFRHEHIIRGVSKAKALAAAQADYEARMMPGLEEVEGG